MKQQKDQDVGKAKDKVSQKRPVQLNQILAGVVCVLGFLFILFIVLLESISRDRFIKGPLSNRTQLSNRMIPECMAYGCNIKCYYINSIEELNNQIELISSNQTLCPKKILFVVNCKLNICGDNTTSVINYDFQELTVEGGNLNDYLGLLEASKKVTLMVWRKLEIPSWEENTLKGFDRLVEFSIRECFIYNIEKDVLKPIKNSLETFQLQQTKNKIQLDNITSGFSLRQLETVDIQYNYDISPLNPFVFSGLVGCKSFYFKQNNIEEVQPNVFAGMTSLIQLDIANNDLQNLRRDSFGPNMNCNLKITVTGNSWRCDCQLQWLKEMLAVQGCLHKGTCNSPQQHYAKYFDDVELCPNETTSTEPTTITSAWTNLTSSPSTEVTTQSNVVETTINENIINLICSTPPRDYQSDESTTRKVLSTEMQAQIPIQTVTFDIFDGNDYEVTITVKTILTDNDLLIWFKEKLELNDLANLPHTIKCMTNLSNEITLRQLAPGETYSFCFVTESERKVSPFNCRAHIVRKLWSEQAWLTNKSMPLTISVMGISLVMCWFLGAIIIYVLIRKNPSLLRGSKRVVMVKSRTNTDSVIVIPSSLDGTDKVGKMSRTNLDMDRSFMKRPFRRSVSEISLSSIRSIDPSYVSAAEPTTAQLWNWRLERLKNKNGHDLAIRERSAELPPLPPPNPPIPPKVTERPPSPVLINHYESLTSLEGNC